MARLRGLELTVWKLHCAGLSPSQIAERVRCAADWARNTVVKVWAEDKEGPR